ncbi:tuliposide A-converting enzyme 2, chloroplastic [Canna indica]|uniref:Tuliposide A-converting enzyme 2, chloroplastic n=1 Tax=Canna indica TaxID=4628 RepID=A0AAQ3JT35_9LILI|nr:tuliposide A-converting enzyme 2, chloroplastic [Canna indica]
MDADDEIVFDMFPFFRQYKSGRVVRSFTDIVPAGIDAATGVASKDVVIDPSTGLSVRLHLPTLGAASHDRKLPVLVYFHGGAFLIGSAFDPHSHHYLNEVVAKASVLAVSVDYRLAPEHPLPTAYEDAWAVLLWIVGGAEAWLSERGDLERVFLAGCSAGANIAHQVALRAGAEALPARARVEGMILLHPYFWGREPVGAERRDAEFRAKEERVWRFVCPESKGVDDPYVNPVAAGAPSLTGVVARRVLVAVAEEDWLRERGRVYCEGLKASGWGGAAELVETKGEGHAFHVSNPRSEKAQELMQRVVDFLGSNTS